MGGGSQQIIRGLALGVAFIMYGREEEADTLIEQLTREQDPILRWGLPANLFCCCHAAVSLMHERHRF